MTGSGSERFDASAYYDDHASALVRLKGEVEFALKDELGRGAVKLHSITGRVKDKDSYLDKIKRKAYEDPLDQVEDLVGVRVVCLFITDLPLLRDVVSSSFEVLSEDNKVESGADDAFGYMSVHYVCRFKPEVAGPRYRGLEDFKFEIQCRTILMDAWANVSHYLAYKGENSVPRALKKDFHALAGLFFVADKHFEILYQASDAAEVKAEATLSLDPTFAAQSHVTGHATLSGEGTLSASASSTPIPIDRSTMLAYFRLRLPDRPTGGAATASEFVEEVIASGYETIADLDATLAPAWERAVQYERDHPPSRRDPWDLDESIDEDELDHGAVGSDDDDDEGGEGDGRFQAVGLARMALAIADPGYAASRLGGDTMHEYRN